MRVLIVEDDPGIASGVRRGLVRMSYSVDIASDGEQGLELALINDYDLIILDIMLPKMDGKTVCRELRRKNVSTPILMLTALGSSHDVILGLDEGADDYLTKPFDLGILLARVRSLIRRSHDQPAAEIRIADLVIHTATRNVQRNGRPIVLTAKEFALLEYLVMNRGKVISRESIGEHIWDINFDPKSNVIDSLIRLVRQKIDKDFDVPLIQTVRGVGYRFADSQG